MPSVRDLAQTSILYGAGNFIRRAINLILLPVFTRVLSPADYGTSDLLSQFQLLMIMLVALGIDQGAGRLLYEKDDPLHRRSVISTCFVFLMCSSALCILGLLFLGGLFPQFFHWVGPLYLWILLAVAFIPSVIVDYVAKVLRWMLQPVSFIFVNVGVALLQGIFSIIFVVSLHHGVAGIFEAFLLSRIIIAGLGLFFIRAHLAPVFIKAMFQEMKRIGFPLVPFLIILLCINILDRYFLAYASTRADVGLYGVASRLAMVLTFMSTAFEMGFLPWAFAVLRDNTAPELLYARVLDYFVLIIILPFGGISLWAKEVTQLIAGPEFLKAWIAVFPICLGVFFNSLYNQFRLSAFLKKETGSFISSAILAGGCNLVAILLLVPWLGFLGAAWAMPITFFPAAVMLYILGRKLHPIPYNLKLIGNTLSLAILAGILGLLLTSISLGMGIIIKVGISLAFLGGWYKLGGAEIVKMVRTRLGKIQAGV